MRTKISAIVASTWRICIIAVALVAVVSGLAHAGKSISKIDITKKADRTIICVQGENPLIMRILKGSRGNYIGFHFPMQLLAKGRMVGVHSGGISCIRYGNFSSNPPASRIVINTLGGLQYSSDWTQDKTQVTITIWKRGVIPVKPEPVIELSCKPIDKNIPKQAQNPSQPCPAVGQAATEALTQPSAPVNTKSISAILANPALAFKEMTGPRERITPARASAPVLQAPTMPAQMAARIASVQPSVTSKVLGMVETASTKPTAVKITLNPAPKPVPAAVPVPVTTGKTVSLNVLGADINDVFKALSTQSGQNIVAGKDVKGEVTVSLNNVSLDQAMDYVAKLSGYTYVKENGTYLVASKDSINSLTGNAAATDQSSRTEVFSLYFTKSEDVLAILEKMFPDLKTSSKKAGASDDSKTVKAVEFIAISGPAPMVEQAMIMVEKLETSVKQTMAGLTTEIYTIKYGSPRAIGESLVKLVPGVFVAPASTSGFALSAPADTTGGASAGGSGSAGGDSGGDKSAAGGASSGGKSSGAASGLAEVNCQAISISGPAEQVTRAIELAQRLDVKPPMINIEAKVTSISKDGSEKLGMKFDWSDINFVEGFTDFNKITSDAPNAENIQNVKRGNSLWLRNPLNFGASLSALVTSGNAQVLASPNLLCLEGMPGTFFVGDEVTYIERIETTATGQNIKTATKQVGVQLRVISDVNPDGYITLNLHPEVSTITLNQSQGVTLPVISRRFTDHVVRVKDGETIAIGGLIRSDEVKAMSKVPLLGDLPFIGNIFRHRENAKTETEVVMFITAKQVKD